MAGWKRKPFATSGRADVGSSHKLAVALVFVIVGASSIGARAPATDNDADAAAYTHAVSELWARQFPSPDISYLLLDLKSNSIGAQRWDDAEKPVPAGSLVKPFTAIAYAENHDFRFPRHTCAEGACWLPRGHGELGFVRALAVSCNSYFISLAEDVSAAQVSAVARRFGLSGPGTVAGAEELVGMHGAWHESPSAIAHAYAELLGERLQPGVREIVACIAQASKNGTAAGLSAGAPQKSLLAKTGTAHCTHRQRAPGDGFVVVAWPADSPRYLLLLREHGRPGAQAAVLAGRMLRALGEAQP